MKHLTPVVDKQSEAFTTSFTADLTGNPVLPAEMLDNVFSLAELLTVYQDSRTIIMAIPQTQLYAVDKQKLETEVEKVTRTKLDNSGVISVESGFDYLKEAFTSQVDIRAVPFNYDNKGNRPLQEIVLHPAKMLEDKRQNPQHKLCRFTGTPFVSSAPEPKVRLDQIFSSTFTDTEFVGSGKAIAPLSYLYVINSYKKSRAFRGAFALLAPATHFALDKHTVQAIENPALDIGGRFANALSRVTVTTQEFTLFQQMSRRIIAKIWHETVPGRPLPLPYLGAIFITDEQRLESNDESKGNPPQLVKAFVPKLQQLLSDTTLLAYPFRLRVGPAVELALEVRVSNSARHYTMHTLLKTKPQITSVGSRAQLYMQLEDKEQVMLNEDFFKRLETLQEATRSLKKFKKKGKSMIYQKDTWLKLTLSGDDPVTAAFESEKALIDTKRLPEALSLETAAFSGAEKFWDEQLQGDSLGEMWDNYQNLKQGTSSTLEQHPYMERVFRLFQNPEAEDKEQ